MEEKIGKLLELLNEYLSPSSGYIHYHNGNGFKRTPTKSAVEGDRMLQDEYICSKKFGFIKWLVEDDKIDHGKLSNYIIDNKFFGDKIAELKEYETLLMLLSISQNPISDLISYLK